MGRGPSYPYVDLEQGVSLAKKLYDYAKRSPAPVDSVITEAWKYSPTSSSGLKVLAALKAYGLVEEQSGTNGKALKLTNRAIRILLDEPDAPERLKELKLAALAPKWYEQCWRTWGAEMPPSMRSNLLIEHGFVDTTVDSFIRDYKRTIAFAGLLSEDRAKKEGESGSESRPEFKVGDYVQWESMGTWQFPVPLRIKSFSDDMDYAFVDGYNTGIPTNELLAQPAPTSMDAIVTPPTPKQEVITTLPHPNGATMRQDVFSLAEGTVTIQWPSTLSPDSYQDFTDWLEILKRKIGRVVESKATGGASNEG